MLAAKTCLLPSKSNCIESINVNVLTEQPTDLVKSLKTISRACVLTFSRWNLSFSLPYFKWWCHLATVFKSMILVKIRWSNSSENTFWVAREVGQAERIVLCTRCHGEHALRKWSSWASVLAKTPPVHIIQGQRIMASEVQLLITHVSF